MNFAAPMKGGGGARAVWEVQADKYFAVDAEARAAGGEAGASEDAGGEEAGGGGAGEGVRE